MLCCVEPFATLYCTVPVQRSTGRRSCALRVGHQPSALHAARFKELRQSTEQVTFEQLEQQLPHHKLKEVGVPRVTDDKYPSTEKVLGVHVEHTYSTVECAYRTRQYRTAPHIRIQSKSSAWLGHRADVCAAR